MQNEVREQLLYNYVGFIVVIYAALLVIVGVIAGVVFLAPRANTAGLEGIWLNPIDPKHTYQFQLNGEVVARFGDEPNGRHMTWTRIGNLVIVRTERPTGDWELVGLLNGNEILGQSTVHDASGKSTYSHQEAWRR